MRFVDTDRGLTVEFRVNSASGKLEIVAELESFLDPAIREVDKCMREGATIICGDVGQTTAPDEDTARRVIELFEYCSTKATEARLQAV